MKALRSLAAVVTGTLLVPGAIVDPLAGATAGQPAAPTTAPVESTLVSYFTTNNFDNGACGVFDTSQSGGRGPVQGLRGFQVSDVYGASGTGCRVPFFATSVPISITVSAASSQGTLAAFPFHGSIPTATTLAFAAASKSVSMPIVGVSQNSVEVHVTGGPAQIAGTVFGYFEPQFWAQINADGTIRSNSGYVISTIQGQRQPYALQLARSGCKPVVTPSTLGNVATTAEDDFDGIYLNVYIGKWSGGTYVPVNDAFAVSC